MPYVVPASRTQVFDRAVADRLVVSVIVLTYARDAILAQAIDELATRIGDPERCEVILVDNNDDDIDRGALLSPFRHAQWLQMGGNRGVIARNTGMAAARGQILCLLDDDVFVRTDGFDGLLVNLFAENPRLGVVTIRKLLHDTGDTRRDLIPHTRKDLDLQKPFLTFRFVGGFVAFNRAVYDQLGGFSREFFYGIEEIEYAYRVIGAGWEILYSPQIVAVELEHPAGRRPNKDVQTDRLLNKWIISYIHMPAPQVFLNLPFFGAYIFMATKGQVRPFKAAVRFGQWLARKDRTRRSPINAKAVAYIRACGGSTWR